MAIDLMFYPGGKLACKLGLEIIQWNIRPLLKLLAYCFYAFIQQTMVGKLTLNERKSIFFHTGLFCSETTDSKQSVIHMVLCLRKQHWCSSNLPRQSPLIQRAIFEKHDAVVKQNNGNQIFNHSLPQQPYIVIIRKFQKAQTVQIEQKLQCATLSIFPEPTLLQNISKVSD